MGDIFYQAARAGLVLGREAETMYISNLQGDA
jgi:hypothetical protein